VLVVEHDAEIIRAAEHLIDIGPRAGEHGGEIEYNGPMSGFLREAHTLTARYMTGEKEISPPKTPPRSLPLSAHPRRP